ncbi:predicted protein, partial [Nematostella vectensis]
GTDRRTGEDINEYFSMKGQTDELAKILTNTFDGGTDRRTGEDINEYYSMEGQTD